jgi:hypothetical protein
MRYMLKMLEILLSPEYLIGLRLGDTANMLRQSLAFWRPVRVITMEPPKTDYELYNITIISSTGSII